MLVDTHSLAVTMPGEDVEPWQAFLFEALITAMLCFTVHGATNIKRKGQLYINTHPIGGALALGILMGVRPTLTRTYRLNSSSPPFVCDIPVL